MLNNTSCIKVSTIIAKYIPSYESYEPSYISSESNNNIYQHNYSVYLNDLNYHKYSVDPTYYFRFLFVIFFGLFLSCLCCIFYNIYKERHLRNLIHTEIIILDE